ncbi:MAG: hypothetical protein ACLQIB_23735 [Isosphaeraceae bacterium]
MLLDAMPPSVARAVLIATLLGCLSLQLALALWPRLLSRRASWRRVVMNRPLAVVATGLLSLWVCLLLHRVSPDTPVVTDEYAYLIASQTFAEGRLTNPQHPLWQHFQAEHILDSPTYMAKYPPAQGLALAAGRILFGDPWWGVWIPFACGAAAVCWMLQAWVSRRWALIGGLMTAVHPSMHNQLAYQWHGMHLFSWTQSFWGGGVAMLGGALFLGGVRRAVLKPRAWPCFVTSVGMLILANSRPFEGLLVVAATLCYVAVIAIRRIVTNPGELRAGLIHRLCWPALIPLVVGLGAMARYNKAVTNSYLQFPYMAYEQRHSRTPLFWWLPPRAISHADPAVMVWDYSHFQGRGGEGDYSTVRDVLAVSYDKIQTLTYYFFGFRRWYLCVPFLFVFGAVTLLLASGTWSRAAVVIAAVFGVGILQATYIAPHYSAPLYPLLQYFWCRFLRFCCLPSRTWFVPGRLVAACLMIWSVARFQPIEPVHRSPSPASVRQELEERGGLHLVLVDHDFRGAPGNEADIDRSKVIFARVLSPEDNARLLEYYRGRTVWKTTAWDYQLVPVRPNVAAVGGSGKEF